MLMFYNTMFQYNSGSWLCPAQSQDLNWERRPRMKMKKKKKILEQSPAHVIVVCKIPWALNLFQPAPASYLPMLYLLSRVQASSFCRSMRPRSLELSPFFSRVTMYFYHHDLHGSNYLTNTFSRDKTVSWREKKKTTCLKLSFTLLLQPIKNKTRVNAN